jgi:histidinol-phosphate aminotransferase
VKPWLEAIARDAILAMKPYASARSLGPLDEDAVMLDANESPWPGAGESLNRYPDPKPAALISALASLYGAEPERLFVGRGSDEAIDCLLRCFCEAGASSVVTPSPSYGVYETAAAIQGARVLKAPLAESDGFEVRAEAVIAAAEADTRLVFLCSPNNPTGRSVAADAVREICRAFEGRALVVLDEAYVEFSRGPSLAPEAGKIQNLVVLRTLSKSWGLAGLRVGAALGDPEVVELLDRVRAPYPLARPVIDAALAALGDGEAAAERSRRLIAERTRLAAGLEARESIEVVFPSDANFLLLKTRGIGAGEAASRLRERGVVIRVRGAYLRVSVGSEEENARLLSAFDGLEEASCEK